MLSALPLGAGLGEVMPLPSAAGVSGASGLLDLIPKEVRTTHRAPCPKSFAMTGILGRWAILVQIPCQQWACPVCGERKARHYAGIARGGCALSTERLRLLTISCPRETPAESWVNLGHRWDVLSKRLARRLKVARSSRRIVVGQAARATARFSSAQPQTSLAASSSIA